MESFDEIYVLDLHGNAKKRKRAPDGEADENAFDIQQGAAIGLCVKRAGSGGGPARVLHADLRGRAGVGARRRQIRLARRQRRGDDGMDGVGAARAALPVRAAR